MKQNTMFTVCAFCLDDVLVKLKGQEQLHDRKDGESTEAFQARVKEMLASSERTLVSLDQLNALRQRFPRLRLGINSKGSLEWVSAVASVCWPGFAWDFFYSLKEKKFEFHRHMPELHDDSWGVIVCGSADSVVFGYESYRFYTVLATWGWDSVPFNRGKDTSASRWRDWNAFAEAQIDVPDELFGVLEKPERHLPLLERLLMGDECTELGRMLETYREGPHGSNLGHRVFGLGRYFSSGWKQRHGWPLSKSILAMKDATHFPEEWLKAVSLVVHDIRAQHKDVPIVLTVIPSRPGDTTRVTRLQAFLAQLEASGLLTDCNVSFAPELMGYSDGVLSNHENELNYRQRYENVASHIFLNERERLRVHPAVVVIDDVITSGATMCCAAKLLSNFGACWVVPLGMAITVSQKVL